MQNNTCLPPTCTVGYTPTPHTPTPHTSTPHTPPQTRVQTANNFHSGLSGNCWLHVGMMVVVMTTMYRVTSKMLSLYSTSVSHTLSAASRCVSHPVCVCVCVCVFSALCLCSRMRNRLLDSLIENLSLSKSSKWPSLRLLTLCRLVRVWVCDEVVW